MGGTTACTLEVSIGSRSAAFMNLKDVPHSVGMAQRISWRFAASEGGVVQLRVRREIAGECVLEVDLPRNKSLRREGGYYCTTETESASGSVA